jgi:hypothetical protein
MAAQPPPPHPYGPQGAPEQHRPMPPPPMAAYPYGYAPPANDSKAIVSLVLGLLGLTCFGILSGIPAIALGVMSRRDIARSQGALGGGAMAVTGIVLGTLSSLITVCTVVMMFIPFIYAGTHSPPTSAPTILAPPPTFAAPTPLPTSKATSPTTSFRGSLKVLELHAAGGSLERQLIEAQSHARSAGRSVLVETTSASSPSSREFDVALSDTRMQSALRPVDLVRVSVDEFAEELTSLKMETDAVPFFYRIDTSARPTDALSADEWDDNTAVNMAPVLEAFVRGTLRSRKHPTSLGTTL